MSTVRAILGLFVVAASLAFPALAAAQDAVAAPSESYDYDYGTDTDPAALEDFREPLAPYGTWVDDPTYGTVWVPSVVVVGEDFQPYRTAGRWAVTDEGDWVWVSDYDWGYIPFHYGRWVWISGSGWAWVPGRVYAPAWVVWRTGEPGYAYVGWAPAPPAYVWFGGVAVGFYAGVVVPWWYCPSAWLFSPHWHSHVLVDHHHVSYAHHHTHYHDDYHGHGGRHGGGGHRPATGQAAGSSGGHAPAQGAAAGGDGGTARVGEYARRGIPRSPSFGAAQVPKASIPQERVKPNQKAMALRKPSSSRVGPGARGASPSLRQRGASGGAMMPARPSQRSSNTTIPREPRVRTMRGAQPSAPAWRGQQPGKSRSGVSQPSRRGSYSSPHQARPAPRGYSSPSHSRSVAPPSRGPRPAMRAPSGGRSYAPSRGASSAPKASKGHSKIKSSSKSSSRSRSRKR